MESKGKTLGFMGLVLLVVFTLSACGKSNNKVNSGNPAGMNAPNALPLSSQNQNQAQALVNFEGVYDVVRMDTGVCGGSIRIVAECGGYRLFSNDSLGPQEFCHINESTSSLSPNSRPPGPDRNPPGPDGFPTTTERAVVTQTGNEIKSVLRIGPSLAFTNTLTLEGDKLTQVALLKSASNRCVFQKR